MAQTLASISGSVRLGATSLVFDPIPSALPNVTAALNADGAFPTTLLVAAVDAVPVLYNVSARNGATTVDGFSVGFAAGGRTLNVADGRITTSATYVALRETTAITQIHAADDTLSRILKGNGMANMVVGGNGRDAIDAGSGNDTVEGRSGNDVIQGGLGADSLFGGLGNDTLFAYVSSPALGKVDRSANMLDGGEGNDMLFGSAGMDTLIGGNGADTLQGDMGADSLDGGSDNDRLVGGAGSDALYGGAGNDILFGHIDPDTGSTTETGNNTLMGGSGNDRLVSSSGADVLDGGEGNDTVRAGSGNDTIYAYQGNDWIDAGEGNDRVAMEYGSAASLTIELGGGNDTLESGGGTVSTQLVNGGSGHDRIEVSALVSTSYGGTGNDAIVDRANVRSSDRMFGEADSDLLVSTMGTDSLYGGTGNDWMVVDHARSEGAQTVRVWGGDGNDTVRLDAGSLALNVSASLEAGNDVFWSGPESEDIVALVYGGSGNDALLAMGDGDAIHGGDGNDALWDRGRGSSLFGGNGDDVLFIENELGFDFEVGQATGGAGADLFVIDTTDSVMAPLRITDFKAEQGDRLLIGGRDVDISELSITQSGADTMIRFTSQQIDDPRVVVLVGFTGEVTNDMLVGSDALSSSTAGWNLDPSVLVPDLWNI